MSCEKDALRREMLRRRTEKERDAGGKICERIRNIPQFEKAETVMIYMPIKGEADVRGLISGEKTYLTPVMRDGSIYPAKVSEENIPGAFCVPEPKNAVIVDKSGIDIVIVPGIAFGRDFNRVGFGKGYYDRFLRGMSALKIGVCYAFELVEKIAAEAHDVKMDAIVTEEETLWNRENTLFL